MLTRVDKYMMLVFVDGLGIPAGEVFSDEWADWYEGIVRHLLAANGDAEDVTGPGMGQAHRQLIVRASVILRDLLAATAHTNQSEE